MRGMQDIYNGPRRMGDPVTNNLMPVHFLLQRQREQVQCRRTA